MDENKRPGETKPDENAEKPIEISETSGEKIQKESSKKFDAMTLSDADFMQKCAELSASERERKPIKWPGFTGKIAGMKVEDMNAEQFREAERQFLAFKPYTGSASMPSVLALD